MTVGERIKQAREIKGFTQEELGKLCGTTKQTVQKYEASIVTNIPLDRFQQIADALNVDPAVLIGWMTPEELERDNLIKEAAALLAGMDKAKLAEAVRYLSYLKST